MVRMRKGQGGNEPKPSGDTILDAAGVLGYVWAHSKTMSSDEDQCQMFGFLQTRNHVPVFLMGTILALGSIAKPHAGHAETSSPQKEALDLLMANANDRPPLVVTVQMENGMYSMRYDLHDGKSACPRGGDLIVPVGTATDINVTSSDKIIRWTIPQVGFDVTAIPGRIESERLNLTEAGHYQVKPPPGNQDKVSDIPMHVMTLTEFQDWFKKAKVCP